ncbi:MAG TPA: YiiD C-terminal domain-containing protein [Burkholderiaceae bacterium]
MDTRTHLLNPNELEQYLHDHIPLSKAMQVSVLSVQLDGIILGAPLSPNINHQATVFGGSASAVAILAAWSLVHTRLKASGISSDLVIQRNTMHYELPITGTFTVRSFIQTAGAWESFTRMLKRKGRARITVSCVLELAGQPVGHFDGEFVALGADGA